MLVCNYYPLTDQCGEGATSIAKKTLMNDDYMRHTRIANAVQSTVSRAIHYHQVTEQKGKNFYTHGSGNFMRYISIGAVRKLCLSGIGANFRMIGSIAQAVKTTKLSITEPAHHGMIHMLLRQWHGGSEFSSMPSRS